MLRSYKKSENPFWTNEKKKKKKLSVTKNNTRKTYLNNRWIIIKINLLQEKEDQVLQNEDFMSRDLAKHTLQLASRRGKPTAENKNRKAWSGEKVERMIFGSAFNMTRSTMKKTPMSGLNMIHVKNNII